MKNLFFIIILIPGFIFAETICSDYKISEGDAFHWAEKDINETAAKESMAALQNAIDNDGAIGMCHLPNAVKLVEGYILKQQAQAALTGDNVPDVIKKMNVSGFCEFLKNNAPCE